jgi:hypothetical protein
MRDTQEALVWITDLLKSLQIPFQISGGLAAQAYGVQRALADIDIDIPEDCFERIKIEVDNFITLGPEKIVGEQWSLLLITLQYQGQDIDLSGAYDTKIRHKTTDAWQAMPMDLSKAIMLDVLGIRLPVIPKQDLIRYKKILAREVDLLDIEQLIS